MVHRWWCLWTHLFTILHFHELWTVHQKEDSPPIIRREIHFRQRRKISWNVYREWVRVLIIFKSASLGTSADVILQCYLIHQMDVTLNSHKIEQMFHRLLTVTMRICGNYDAFVQMGLIHWTTSHFFTVFICNLIELIKDLSIFWLLLFASHAAL